MGQLATHLAVADETELAALAGSVARAWHRVCAQRPLTVGLRGTLGAGKTAWVRAMLVGLGYTGRVPSPTYTLMEIYEIRDITLIHLDFYRLNEPRELEFLGLRDWQGTQRCWVVAEWPERVPGWLESCDITLEISVCGESGRALRWQAHSALGQECLAALLDTDGPG